MMRGSAVAVVSHVLCLLGAGASAADPPAVLSSGQCLTVWENDGPRVYFTVRNNLTEDRSLFYTLSGPGLSQNGFLFVERRDQDSLGFHAPSLPLGAYQFELTLWDTLAQPDSVFWSSAASLIIADSTMFPSVRAEYIPDVIQGNDPLTYPATPKSVVVKIPKSPELAGTREGLLFQWRAFVLNADPGDEGNLFEASPDTGSVSGDPGDVVQIVSVLSAGSPVAFGSINELHFLVLSAFGDTLVHVCTPVVTDSLGTPAITTAVDEASREPVSWGRLKSVFR